MSAQGELPLRSPCDSMSVEELARLQGVKPVGSVTDLARDAFSSDEEVEEFIAFTYAARRRDEA